MLAVDALLVGVVLGTLRGGSLTNLAWVRVRFERAILVLFASQMTLPAILGRLGWTRVFSVSLWVFIMVVLAIAVSVNWRESGMAMAALGISLNALVICLNIGMPVSLEAVEVASGQAADMGVFEADLVHVPLRETSMLPILADIIPLPGPSWHRGVISVGDIALALGIVSFLSGAMARGAPSLEP